MPAKTKDTDAAPDVHWLSGEKEYEIGLRDGKLVCRNPKGKQLASVPKWLKDGDAGQQLTALKDWLATHEQECRSNVELWMLRSLPAPRSVLAEVWPDPAWADVMKNLVVAAVNKKGQLDQDGAGFLRDVDAKKGVGVIDLDGETQWLKSESVIFPHPILLNELDDFRELTVELGFEQALDQLFRQTWEPTAEQRKGVAINEFSDGKFEQLNFATGLCRRLGYRVRGGNATCAVWENGKLIEARYWIGSDYPEGETWTGDLVFTDEKEKSVSIGDVGPVAFSEGMRMAAAIYAKRVVKEEDDED